MTDETVLDRGRRAKAVLEDATVMEAIDYIATHLTQQWRCTATAQAPHREALHAQIAGLDALKMQLRGWVDQAKHLETKLAKDEQRRANSPLRLIRK